MIQFKALRLARGSNVLLDQVNLSIYPKQRVGLVGANGCGKSSLLALLRGELEADQGELIVPPQHRFSSMRQETPSLQQSALDYVLDGHQALRAAEAALKQAHSPEALAAAHEALLDVDAYALPARAAELLYGLGFKPEAQQQSVASFSGGWRMRLNLAQALIAPADVLLLDEPSNHLDLDALLWLQHELKQRPETQIIIAHDRDFLDALCTHIIHIEQGQARLYSGNYRDFERQYHAQRQQQEALFAQEQQQRAHLEDFVRRFRAKASKAKQAQSRLKALEKLQAAPPPPLPNPYRLRFPPPEPSIKQLGRVEDVVLAYGDYVQIKRFRLQLHAETRIGLLGQNGAGKSTLMKALAGLITPQSGRIQWHPQIKIAYFAQQQLDALTLEESALWHWQQLCPQEKEAEGRRFLGGFGFQGEDIHRPVQHYSGGEKARLALALLAVQKPHLLLLDEPSNHLDLAMRDALTEALQAYEGAVILIAHDRHLLESSCDTFYWIREGEVQLFDGDLDDYQQQLLQEKKSSSHKTVKTPRQDEKRLAAAQRQKRYPLKQALERAEKKHQQLQAQMEALQQQLSEEALYQNPEALKQVLAEESALKQALLAAEALWFEALEAYEAAD